MPIVFAHSGHGLNNVIYLASVLTVCALLGQVASGEHGRAVDRSGGFRPGKAGR